MNTNCLVCNNVLNFTMIQVADTVDFDILKTIVDSDDYGELYKNNTSILEVTCSNVIDDHTVKISKELEEYLNEYFNWRLS